MEAVVARLHAPRQLVFDDELLDPGALAADALLARTEVSVLSVGTELAAYKGLPPLRPGPVYPRVVGYCNVARVVAVGSEVGAIGEGDLILTHQSHRSAFVCRYDDVLLVLQPDVDPGAAATAYLFHLGYVALLNAGFQLGQHVAVVGLGVLGIGAIACSRLGGGSAVGFSGQAALRAVAAEVGATATYGKDDPDAVEEYVLRTAHGGADVVVVTGDGWDDWHLALRLARPRGVISVVGFPGRGQALPTFNPLDSQYFYDKQLRVQASGWTPARYHSAQSANAAKRANLHSLVEHISDGSLPARALISSEHHWSELASVYEALADSRDGRLTCLIRWED